MRKNIKALLVTGMILLPLTACNSTMEAKEETSYPIAYVLKGNGTYTLTNYDRLVISKDTFFNSNGKIFKFSISENFYVVENIGKKDYGDYYIWYYSPDVSWNIEVYYSTK
nr:MAG TPA: putative peptidyl-prolyl cis-trans isomerase [Caudoviricetes sp.]